MQKMEKPRALSLFSGAGGLDIGFSEAGFEIVGCIEIDEVFCDTLKSNVGKYFSDTCLIINDDIRNVDPASLDNIRPIDVIIGGPPCQPFSAAGRRAGGVSGILDARGSLFEQYCRFVEYFKPEIFIFENVRGILHSNKGEDWKEILAEFQPLNYSLFYKVLDAADYGVPQHRERLILAGVREGDFLFPRPTRGPDSLSGAKYVSAGEAIADLQPNDEPIHDYGGKYGDLLKEVPPGMNYHYFTKEMGYPNPVFAWRSRFSDFLYKADPDQPVKTIVAKLGRYSGPFHWKARKFTLAEMMRLQSFPDDYLLSGSLNQQLQQIGNSVAPRFAYALALAIKKQFFDPTVSVDLLPSDYKLSFDERKRKKAMHTRKLRIENQTRNAKMQQLQSRFDYLTEFTKQYFYSSPSERQEVQSDSDVEDGVYKFEFTRNRENISVIVSKYCCGKFLSKPLLTYSLNFHSLIGSGITKIVCSLNSDQGIDIPIAWDAIELALRAYSNYHSLMDIFGHFTEPHPIFDLTCLPANGSSDPIMLFAVFFSKFENTSKILPAKKLKEIMGVQERMMFLDTVKFLRGLRFDIRVHETNATIPPKTFRCTYPFTLGYDKQISVTWKDKGSENENLAI